MKSFVLDPKIVATAAGLHLDRADPVRSILNFCRERVSKILKRARGIQTIWDVERIVCEHVSI